MWKMFILSLVLLAGCTSNAQSVSEIINSPGNYLNKEISVTGIASSYLLKCTQIACEDSNPCCNECGGRLAIEKDEYSLQIEGIVCKGNECSQTCGDFKTGQTYTVKGMLKLRNNEYVLDPL